jgi:DNA polymerase-3 subunit alpha (Gram-positive type)
MEIEEITPVQFPADAESAEWKTTHFDYHSFEANLLKLDILGHDDPTMMHMLYELTGKDPITIPMNDPNVMKLFSSTEPLNVSSDAIRSNVGTYGVPEMGTKFVRQMLEETNPTTFSDLLQISGLSHGTDVWLGNAQELIKSKTCTIKTVIGCRDEIMLYLIYKAGMEASLAFTITESVRKGKGLKDEWIEDMKKHKVPDWYIQSCLKIKYMFPKAHAAAYVISAVRTAFYKIYYPIEFYAAYFSIRVSDFDISLFREGYKAIAKRHEELAPTVNSMTAKDREMYQALEMALEMTARGYSFKSIDIHVSHSRKFLIQGKSLLPPFCAISGCGESVAQSIEIARQDGEFLSIEDFQSRSKCSKTVIDTMREMGCFAGMPENNQMSLFDY